jgi:hypothetical protein
MQNNQEQEKKVIRNCCKYGQPFMTSAGRLTAGNTIQLPIEEAIKLVEKYPTKIQYNDHIIYANKPETNKELSELKSLNASLNAKITEYQAIIAGHESAIAVLKEQLANISTNSQDNLDRDALKKQANQLGFVEGTDFPSNIPTAKLRSMIEELNAEPK